MAKKNKGSISKVALLALGLLGISAISRETVKPESPVMEYRGLGVSPTKPLKADEPGAYRTSL